MRHRGIGPIISAQIVTEIIDIRRFKSNHKPAAYAGVARVQKKTGRTTTERSQQLYNHRLKNAFFNPDSHLSGYYRHLRSEGMRHSEAYKRVGRALIRVFYRELMSVAQNEAQARHEGNPEPLPERAQDQEQPHASPNVSAKNTTMLPKPKAAVSVAAGSETTTKEANSS